MIDLKPFCALEATRFNVCDPWTDGDSTYATDAVMAVRVPSSLAVHDKGDRRVPDISKLPHWSKVTEVPAWTPLPPVTALAGMATACGECQGSGTVAVAADCTACDGTGYSDCHECEACDGSGEDAILSDGEEPCEKCGGNGKASVEFLGERWSHRRLAAFAGLPNPVAGVTPVRQGRHCLHVRCDVPGFQGILLDIDQSQRKAEGAA